MKQVPVEELVEAVRVTLDENQVESEYLESSTDNMELNEIIRAKLPDAARAIVEMCPLSLLNADALTLPADDQVANTDGSGYIVLPDDCHFCGRRRKQHRPDATERVHPRNTAEAGLLVRTPGGRQARHGVLRCG